MRQQENEAIVTIVPRLTGALGYDVWVLAAIAAPLITATVACVVLLRRAETTVPHGPSMCVSSAVAAVLAML